MTLKQQLELFQKEFTSLKEKIKKRLGESKKSLTETTNRFNESSRKLELLGKENNENEQVLTQLLKEMEELVKEIES